MTQRKPVTGGSPSTAERLRERRGPSSNGRATPPTDGTTEGGAPPPWQPIAPLSSTPEADPFPLEVLPDQLQPVVREIAAALNVPPDFAAVPLLVLAGAAIGMSRILEFASGEKQRTLLYAGIVGDPGTLKTPALGIVRRPMDTVQKEHRTLWDAGMVVHEGVMKEYEEAMKAWAKDKAKGTERPIPIEPERPILRRVVVSDTTAESLIPILQDNPRGFVSIRDEITAWISGMDQYKSGKGAEKELWLSGWSSEPIYVDRKMHHAEGYLACAAPFIAVIGCLTPESLTEIRGDERGRKAKDDGFIDRVLLAFPEGLPARGDEGHRVSASTHDALETVIRKLFTLDMIGITKQGSNEVISYRPRAIDLTDCGKTAWKEFTHAHAAEVNAEDFAPCLKGPWSKLRGYCGRLALILHYLRWSCGELPERGIDGATMRAAARLVGYFKSHARKVHHVMGCDPATEDAAKVLRWIERKRLGCFTQRDALCGPLRKTAVEVESALKILCDHGYIRLTRLTPPVTGAGRPSSPSYEVNPACLVRD